MKLDHRFGKRAMANKADARGKRNSVSRVQPEMTGPFSVKITQAAMARPGGFTLLELMIVLFILGLIAAMAVPAIGLLDEAERTRITRERMTMIQRAILGPDDRFDAKGRPVIGGYVGDMRAWPDLWEARAEIKPNYSGLAWDTPMSMPEGLGQWVDQELDQEPDYPVDDSYVFFRPSGRFVKGRWRWNLPYRKLYDDPDGNDHIGGLAVENEGQPRGLWTRTPEELPFDLPNHPAPGEDLGNSWKGPYLYAPADDNPSDSGHWAETDLEYEALEPVWHKTGIRSNHETWEDGDYEPTSGELGEFFDDKESFRLGQTEGRLTDGWGRALRFFITDDPDHEKSTIFWILSEGPDGMGEYPNKGTCDGDDWIVDDEDTMAEAYDETAAKNRDNIVLKLYSRDWEAIFAVEQQEKESETERILARIRDGLVGHSPTGRNTGFTGDLTVWPRLFRWEESTSTWDDQDDAGDPYTKGQPRGMWTDRPNGKDVSDNRDPSQWGLGWRHGYIRPPEGYNDSQVLRDAWGREILFFKDKSNDSLLILSRGADGRFNFGTVGSGGTEPEAFTKEVDVTGYNPADEANADNRTVKVTARDWKPGFFRLQKFTVYNAIQDTTKAGFFRSAERCEYVDLETCKDVDLLTAGDDGTWTVGIDEADPAFKYDDTTAETVPTGARYLVFWNDGDGNNEIDSGEAYTAIIYNVSADAGSVDHEAVTVNTSDFQTLP